jgi:hypothetical protein
MKVATKAPTIPRPAVRMKPVGSFGPGYRKRVMTPARRPMTFDMAFSLDLVLGHNG